MKKYKTLSLQIKLYELLFYIAFLIYMIEGVAELTLLNVTANRNNIYFICICILLSSILSRKRINKKNLLFGSIAFLITVITYFNNQLLYLILLLMFIYASRGINKRKVVLLCLIVHSVFFTICIVGSKIGLLQNRIWNQNGRIRESLGYQSFNYPTKIFFYMILYYVFIKNGKINLKELAVIILLNLFLFKSTDSRATWILSPLFLLIIILIHHYQPNLNKRLFKIIGYGSVIICCLLPILLTLLYTNNPSRFGILDLLLTNRLRISAIGIKTYGITLFGKVITWQGVSWNSGVANNANYNYVDSSILQILLNDGIFFCIIVIAMQIILMSYAIEKNDLILYIIIIFIIARSMIEPQLIDLKFNSFILIVSDAINYYGKSRFLKYKR